MKTMQMRMTTTTWDTILEVLDLQVEATEMALDVWSGDEELVPKLEADLERFMIVRGTISSKRDLITD